MWENWAISDITDITVSSEQLQFPKTFLRDPLRSKRWRTQLGWNVDGEINNTIDFDEGGPALLATIASGNYATGAAYAAAVKAALDAAGGQVYTVTYSGVTNDFTISAAGVFDLLWSTGANFATSAARDLGFDDSADDTGLTSYTGDVSAYGSVSWVKFDFGAGTPRDVRALIAFDGNFIASTIITVEANATDAWGAPTFSTTLTLDTAVNDFVKALAFIDTTTLRYWRIVINDAGNPDGFTEMGVPYVGDYQEPSNGYAAAFTDDRIELTGVAFAEEGANFQHVRNTAFRNSLNWLGIPTAEKPKFDEMAKLVKVGKTVLHGVRTTRRHSKDTLRHARETNEGRLHGTKPLEIQY